MAFFQAGPVNASTLSFSNFLRSFLELGPKDVPTVNSGGPLSSSEGTRTKGAPSEETKGRKVASKGKKESRKEWREEGKEEREGERYERSAEGEEEGSGYDTITENEAVDKLKRLGFKDAVLPLLIRSAHRRGLTDPEVSSEKKS